MQFHILTLFPNFFSSFLEESLLGKAIKEGSITIKITNIRDFADDKHHTVDDVPFGGGEGMVMKPEPIVKAVEAIKDAAKKTQVILLTPQGERLNQPQVQELTAYEDLIIICGRYEGVDERVVKYVVDREISIGDFILMGGESAAIVLIEAVARLVPGVLGNNASVDNESFSSGLLEYPQYTRPRFFRGTSVPEILLSGDHNKIARWRRREALRQTLKHRPDLLHEAKLDQGDLELVEEISKMDG